MNESPKLAHPSTDPSHHSRSFFFEGPIKESVVSRSSLLGSVLDRLRLLQCLPFHLIPRGSRFQITALLLGIFWVRGSQTNPSARGFLAFWWFCLPNTFGERHFLLESSSPKVHRYHPDLCDSRIFLVGLLPIQTDRMMSWLNQAFGGATMRQTRLGDEKYLSSPIRQVHHDPRKASIPHPVTWAKNSKN